MNKQTIPFPGNFPLSSAVIHDAKYTMEISGQIGVNPESGELEEGINDQTTRVMETIKSLLAQVGWDTSNVTKVRIFLSDMADYAAMNEIYATYFEGDYPTRIAMAVKELPRQALVEIECTAAGDKIINQR